VLSCQASEESARLTLTRREESLAEAQADLETKKAELADTQADLAEAEAELAKAENDEIEDFDAFNLNNNIKSAELSVQRMKKSLTDAGNELTQAQRDLSLVKQEYYAAVSEYEIKRVYDLEGTLQEPIRAAFTQAEETLVQKERAKYSAQNNYDDALSNLELAKANLSRESDSFAETEEEKLQNAIESAAQTVEQARQSVTQAEQSIVQGERSVAQALQQVEDAQIAFKQTVSDNGKKLIAARQNIDDAQTSLQNAETELARGQISFEESLEEAQKTYELQSLKLENLTNNDLSIRNAQFAIEEAQTALETAQNKLEQIKIYAPIGGEVLNITKSVGEKAAETEDGPGMFMGSGSTSNSFITIRDLSEIYMTASVPEGDIVGLALGQKIRVAVDALGEENLSATVYSISSIPNTDSSGIISYEIIGVLDEFNTDIRDQMSVFLTFIKKELNGVLLIPNKAVFMEDGQQYVYVKNADGTQSKRAVTCGFSNGTQTEVAQGLEAGETVIVGTVTP
jgi:RND family efflux transporter MFP subunit